MKKIELLSLNEIVSGLKTPTMAAEQRLTLMRAVRKIGEATKEIHTERQAIAETDDTEKIKTEMWHKVLDESVDLRTGHGIEKMDNELIMQLIAANEELTIAAQILILDSLS